MNDLQTSNSRYLLPGWFTETLPRVPIPRLAILRLDGDLCESTRGVLAQRYDRVSPGGFIIDDDPADTLFDAPLELVDPHGGDGVA
jgi:hypothetical protein